MDVIKYRGEEIKDINIITGGLKSVTEIYRGGFWQIRLV
jgi:hypothetical protein